MLNDRSPHESLRSSMVENLFIDRKDICLVLFGVIKGLDFILVHKHARKKRERVRENLVNKFYHVELDQTRSNGHLLIQNQTCFMRSAML